MSKDGIELQIKGAFFKFELLQIVGSILEGVAKTVVAIKSGGASLALLPNAITTFFGAIKGLKRDETLELKAWLLVSAALLYAIEKSLSEPTYSNALTPEALDDFASDLSNRIEARTYTIEPGFFSSPNK